MKNKLMAIGIGFVIVLAIGFGVYQFSTKSQAASLSVEEAKNIATSQFPGTVTEIEFEKEGNRAVYEIEIEGEGMKYELLLDGDTGEVIKLVEKEWNDSSKQVKVTVNDGKTQNTDDQNEAKSNTDDQAEGNENKAEVNDDNADDKSEENVKISAKGNANDDNSDDNSDDKQKQNNTTNEQNTTPVEDDRDDNKGKLSVNLPILQEKAIEIAKAEVGGEVVIEEIELDEEDGRYYYEIEMRSENQEFDMEIDAVTGDILSISSEYEDD
ncbi:PepSY domain-containing protein [Salirhabdus sp. Marseille-P4669]|uniref:PepSY domain-containing protein n=1 Tax=Salirhabdus sp. Marseille-P4669 TaxID=2042310 RepID=UPI000C7BEA35|nr:PepSY domain-containing protein [Salirhabdus sp. Marseille-P4669]